MPQVLGVGTSESWQDLKLAYVDLDVRFKATKGYYKVYIGMHGQAVVLPPACRQKITAMKPITP